MRKFYPALISLAFFAFNPFANAKPCLKTGSDGNPDTVQKTTISALSSATGTTNAAFLTYPANTVLTVGVPANITPNTSATETSYIIMPSLPAGLSLDEETGVISGTPLADMPSMGYLITQMGSEGPQVSVITISITNSAPTNLSYPPAILYTIGNPPFSVMPTVNGTVDQYTVAPALPSGLSLNPATGEISGSPTVTVIPPAVYTVTASNSVGSTSFDITITVNPAAPSNLTYNTPNVFTVGNPIPALFPSVNGTVTSYSVSPALPSGLIITSSGIITGTPSVTSPATIYTITAWNAGGSDSFDISIRVNDVAPSNLSYLTPNSFTVGVQIPDLIPTVTGNIASYSVFPDLPNGLSINSSTGIISGTPTATSATSTYTVTASNSGGSVDFDINIEVNQTAPSDLSYSTPNVFTIGTPVSLSPTVAGTVVSFSASPSLPAGLSINTATGVISGTPTAVAPTTTYTVTATNSGGSATFGISITVNDIAPSNLSYPSPNVFAVGTTIAALNPSVTGNVVSFSISPDLPNGLIFDTATGVISGTPSEVSPATAYTVTAENSGGSTFADLVILVNVAAPSGLSYNTPNVFTVGSPIGTLLPTVNGTVDSYSISPALPAGLNFNPATGAISGVPISDSALNTYTVTATNISGSTTFDIEITVNMPAPGSLSYTSPNVYTVGTPIPPLFAAIVGFVTEFTVSPALPDGLSLDPIFGIISGMPTTVTPTATYTVTASNASGSSSFGIVITVNDVAPSALSYPSPNVFEVGQPFAALNPTVTGNVESYSISPALPDGISIDPTTGAISGIPTSASPQTTYTVTATNSGGSTTFGVVITVNPSAPADLSYNSPNVFTVGTAISPLSPTSSGQVDSYSVSPALPAGLVLNAETGVISGTPTVASEQNTYEITATNAGGSTTFGIVITVNDVPPGALVYASPNVFTVGTAISPMFPAISGFVTGFSVSPDLPDGLSLNTEFGIISGTPTQATPTGIYTVTATNSGGSVSFGITITVNPAAPAALSYPTPNVFTIDSEIADLIPTITGTIDSYSVSPALPSGLSIDLATGVISGTPTAASAQATYTVTATNAGGSTTFGIQITVNEIAPNGLSYTTPNNFVAGTAITPLVPTVTGNISAYSISPALPNGLSINATTGVISGTPSAASALATYTVTATNSGGNTTFELEIEVTEAAPTALSYASPNAFITGNTIAPLAPSVTGNVESYSISPDLPAGLSIDATTGVISGTPTIAAEMAVYTVTATNSGGSISFEITITVFNGGPTGLSYSTPNIYTVGNAIVALVPSIAGNVDSYSVDPELPAGLSIDAVSGIISGTPAGISANATYTVTATNSGGSVSFALEIEVTEAAPSGLSYPTPLVFMQNSAISDIIPTVQGSVTSYSISPNLPDGLVFDEATGIISGTPTVASEMATYVITATNSGGSTTFEIVITVDEELGIGEHDALSFKVYPNPFTDYVNVSGIDSDAVFAVYSAEGKLIRKEKVQNGVINLSELPKGMYILQVSSNGQNAVQKIVKR